MHGEKSSGTSLRTGVVRVSSFGIYLRPLLDLLGSYEHTYARARTHLVCQRADEAGLESRMICLTISAEDVRRKEEEQG